MKLKFERTVDNKGRTSFSARKDGWLFVMTHRLLESQTSYMEIACENGFEVNVMIIGGLGSHVRGVIVDLVTTDYEIVEHGGFECAGTMCCTTARIISGASISSGIITPGRCQDLLPVAENVNVRYGDAPQAKTPGRVYVRIGEDRAAGIPSIDDMCLKTHAAQASFRKAYQARRAA